MRTRAIKTSILILAMGILTSLTTQAQTNVYHPFPTANTIWIGTSWAGGGTLELTYNAYNLYISGDTTIGQHAYHKLYRNGRRWCWPCPPNYQFYYGEYAGCFRQNIATKKVYLYKNGMDTLAYDFNLNVGDTLPKTCLTLGKQYITSIDSVVVDNQYRKRFWVNGCNDALIEGIGGTFGAFAWIDCHAEGGDDLYCVRMNNQIAWTSSTATGSDCSLTSIKEDQLAKNKVMISQNPFSTVTTITSSVNLKNSTLFIYDSSGKLVKELKNISGNTITLQRDNLPSGLYFLRLNQDDKIIATEKLIVSDN